MACSQLSPPSVGAVHALRSAISTHGSRGDGDGSFCLDACRLEAFLLLAGQAVTGKETSFLGSDMAFYHDQLDNCHHQATSLPVHSALRSVTSGASWSRVDVGFSVWRIVRIQHEVKGDKRPRATASGDSASKACERLFTLGVHRLCGASGRRTAAQSHSISSHLAVWQERRFSL